jgi:hypothetical protein
MTPWEVEFHPQCGLWAAELDPSDQEALLVSINVLRRLGPHLGRPLVDSIRHSRHPNMKELPPPPSGRSEVRVLSRSIPSARRSCCSAVTSKEGGQSGIERTSRSQTLGSTNI